MFVTGSPGLAGRGYLDPDPPSAALAALRRPAPRLDFALRAAPFLHAAMDISDGLALDLPRLCAASGCGARIDPAPLLALAALQGGPHDPRTLALCAGDDYELLLVARDHHEPSLRQIAASCGLDLHAIGEITPGSQVVLIDGPWPEIPWSHHPPRSAP